MGRAPFLATQLLATLAITVGVALTSPASAAETALPELRSGRQDATYGRIDGDVAVQLGLGATFGPAAPRATVDLRLRYLQSAGLFLTYEDGPAFGGEADPRRALAFGVELRPLFLGRWLQGLEFGAPYPDLLLDSFALELGAVFAQPPERGFGSRPGLQAGIGLAVPFFPRASGLFAALHGGCRWSDHAIGGGPLAGPSDRALYLNVTIAWQQIFGGHLVDLGDRAPR